MSGIDSGGLVTDMEGLLDVVGSDVGHTDWIVMTQDQVNAFADVTGDHNLLHVNPERAKETPFGGTIAHGFLTLSLLAPVTQRLRVTDAKMAVNYGLDKVRFPAPLPVGKKWRGNAEITEVSQLKGGLQVKMTATVEVEDSDRPAVVAESLVRFYS